MKYVSQSTAAECGLACIAMIADAHGNRIGLGELRRRFPISLKGARLSDLMQIAQTIGLASRPLRLELADIESLQLPCILHWDLNHFVVLKNVKRGKVAILDPAFGERTLSISEVSRRFTGIALELNPTDCFTQQAEPAPVSLKELTGPLRGIKGALVTILLISLALQAFLLISPFFMQWVVDQVLVTADHDLLTVLALGFGLALLLQVAIGQVRAWSVVNISAQLGLQWTRNVTTHLLRLPLNFFEARHLGDIISRLGSIQSIQRTLTTNFVEALVDGLMSIVTLALMLFYSWKLASVTVLAVVAYLTLRWASSDPLKRRTELHLVAAARQETHLLESIRGVQCLKVAGEETQRGAAHSNLLQEAVNQEVRLAKFAQAFVGANQLIFGLERVLVIWIGANLALQNVFSVGMLIAYLAYKDQFALRMAGLVDRAIEFRIMRLHGERLADIVQSEPESSNHGGLRRPDPLKGIEIRNISYRYAAGEPRVVDDCSFTITHGDCVAIVGESGCGKTTLVKLLLGLLKPDNGTILIGGIDASQVATRDFKTMIGAVMQDDQLFAGSIAENISFFDSDYDFDRVQRAAELAAIHIDISAMPMGYQTLIGDMGSSLSGGQKQRLILARALYRNPLILVLDEATSHLDIMKERLVSDAIKRLPITKIIVAHRPETIASADRVLVMEQGRIVQEFRPQSQPETTAS
ncbi:peptidase domain-containing ABC transporter [Mesorhizobium sp. M00.F.Ca.ET.151.01.1.1]|nr:peptidase domain-containing ABC transporter [bacterium M00.F.Ca.ET.199.01.1.1]TGT02968.1 peptidase domain-containing ABC transporter [bacterium M00.F.Ca.ET.177.01.1.1]TGT57904.1 peptidase domain-containing ABC transporter [Mesorhizobium sp. M00.F.Ca.ET.170.01.1.1]TGU06817.1 peptidase domain-containing ABC transporter [bacterium M00.F.Ca.ET.163.01.1.1]TGU91518.1 peptidase domain-containing ABC transporter [Mesorhizobium sp. M00.F.Ca.ET.151.01.1.1]TGV53206.1 peptidase domain-containing ABC tr